jgi:hypothetical protein
MTILNFYAPAAIPSSEKLGSEKLSKVVVRFLGYIVARALRPRRSVRCQQKLTKT